VALLTHDADSVQQFQARNTVHGPVPLLSAELVSAIPVAPGSLVQLGKSANLPFFTAQDLLHALHILRC
jgi:hypothetical protein